MFIFGLCVGDGERYKSKLVTVQLSRIIPIYPESASKAFKRRLKNSLHNGEAIMQYLILEQDPEHDVFYLLSRYPVFQVLQEEGVEQIECLVHPYSNDTGQKIKVLQSMVHNSRGAWTDKCSIIIELVDQKIDPRKIAKRLG